ncbi:hypothetical protein IVA96_15710 [Bradyrhizobium sp. 159]|uniref:DUF6074 family protein n=1 Tax=unclassified Bradyrhizobium TaxID=2631580 RepID=UPI001FF7DEBA|nr:MULTISPECIES: DUF6074 family protein [unclassified Bradyrhizobium]MCK1424605.1 hypothetical protein [Bradyrhizobium sp. CW12]MCK1618065.1 hypothetical protein [Bradyrhizobium sp. 159]MCK1646468.1 hypothetical protein [Bradyrhizobium sp. 154]MCK1758763.1 hypothetical protein [Bradyrhizobium sp. 137]
MTEKTTVLRAVRDARRELAPHRQHGDPARLRVHIAQPKKVVLLPGRFRDEAYVRRHVEFVLSLDAERGEAHVQRNLLAIRRVLDELGVDPADADREVRNIEGRVRAELWKQVLTPGGEQ